MLNGMIYQVRVVCLSLLIQLTLLCCLQDKGYRILRQLRCSPAYWQSYKRDVFAMLR